MKKRHHLKASNSGSRSASVDFRKDSLRYGLHYSKSCFLRVTTLAVTGIFLLLSAGAAKVNASVIAGGGGGFVLDWVDEGLGLAGGHYESHDARLTSGAPDDHGHTGHWTWVKPTPPAAVTTVNYYIHNHGGLDALSADQILRIQEAAGVWNTSGANVSLVEVGLDTLAEIHVHGTPIGSLGLASFTFFTNHNVDGFGSTGTGYTDGHPQHHMVGNVELPFAFSNMRQVLSMDIRADWFNGANAALIGAAQFDYKTIAIQEFGHLLGLGHNGNASAGHAADEALSPMNGNLPIGNALRRTLQPSDTAAIVHLYGAIPEPTSLIVWSLLAVIGLIITYGHRRRAEQPTREPPSRRTPPKQLGDQEIVYMSG